MVNCPPLCQTCDNPGTCQACIDGAFLDPDTQNCHVCQADCTSCISTTECTGCGAGLDLIAGVCVPGVVAFICPQGCHNCLEDGTCTQCKTGYFITQDNFDCIPCISGCLMCNNKATCSLCQLNTELQSDGTCMALPVNANCTLQTGVLPRQ